MICPSCRGMVGNNAASCPKCGYQFIVSINDNLIVTTTNSIEGYVITSYIGIVSGESAIGTGFLSEFSAAMSDLTGTDSSAYSSKLGAAKNAAISRMRQNALKLGADAIVGIDLDVMNTNSNMFIACANGTAVKITKIGE